MDDNRIKHLEKNETIIERMNLCQDFGQKKLVMSMKLDVLDTVTLGFRIQEDPRLWWFIH